MRRSTALRSCLRAQSMAGKYLSFDNCIGGYFSSDPKYSLKVEGRTENVTVTSRNLFPLGDQNSIYWSEEIMYSDQVAEMLEPDTTYTVSFVATCNSRPNETLECSGCGYGYNEETGEEEYISCGTIHRDIASNALGFALVHTYAYCENDAGIGMPDNWQFPTIPMFVDYEIAEGEKYRGVVTFTTPSSLEGYRILAFTNQYYYPHEYNYPETDYSTVSFTEIQIEKGSQATPYAPYGETVEQTTCVKAGSEIVCGKDLVLRSNPNLCPLGDRINECSWAYDEAMSPDEVAEMLEPNKTYTISFDAECTGKPDETMVCSGCWYWDYDNDIEKYDSCGELNRYCCDDALGFALVHEYAEDYSGYGLGVPDHGEYPTVPLCAHHEMSVGERYRVVVTFTTPDSLEGYRLSVFTNQFYYSHYDHPEVYLSWMNFTNIKIEEGTEATPYVPYGEGNATRSTSAKATTDTAAVRIAVPCDLYAGDTWYPASGDVIRGDGSTEKYLPIFLKAVTGNCDVIQEATGTEAQLSATLLTIKTQEE